MEDTEGGASTVKQPRPAVTGETPGQETEEKALLTRD